MSDFMYQTLIKEIRELQQEIEKCEDDIWTLMQANKQLHEALKIATDALEWYAEDSINNHRYHADMDNDLRVKAQVALGKINEKL